MAGRRFETSRRVRLADAAPDGRLRLDALARFLQDVGNDDTADAGHGTSPWITRKTTITAEGWPTIGERVEIVTWCGGMGTHYAERRTDLVSPTARLSAAATWVHVDDVTGRPARLPQWFHDTYASAAEGRVIKARLQHAPPPPSGTATQPWPLRYADLDVVGHVNNAAYWEAVEEVCHQRGLVPTFAEVEYAGGIDAGDEVVLHSLGDAIWLVVDGTVRGSALVR